LERFGEESLSEPDYVALVSAGARTSGELNMDDSIGRLANALSNRVLSEHGGRAGCNHGDRHHNRRTDK